MSRLFAVALLAVSGCGRQLDWYVDAPELYHPALAAAACWCAASDGEFCPQIYPEPIEGASAIRAVTLEQIRDRTDDHEDACGRYWWNPAAAGTTEEILVCVDYRDVPGSYCRASDQTVEQALQGTIAHELGHAAGLDHASAGTMTSLHGEKHCPTAEDWP